MWFILIVTIFLLIVIKKVLEYKNVNKKGFWEKFGIMEVDVTNQVPQKEVLLGKRCVTERDDYAYELMGDKVKFCGMLESPRPVFLIKDFELIKKIFIKEFDSFIDRRPFFGAARDDSVLRKMLGNLRGDEWKGVRASVTPTFTAGKIRHMMEPINSVGLDMVSVLTERSEKEGPFVVDVNVISNSYTVDVIAAAIFGLQARTVKDPTTFFAQMADRLVNLTPFLAIKFGLALRFPKIFQFFNIDFLDMESMRFFEELLYQNLQTRMKEIGDKKTRRNDFLQLLVEAKKAELAKSGEQFLSDKVMRGQCLSFFFAGFRTTSSLITFVIHALALHQDVQDKVRKEVDAIFKDDEGLDYDTLGQLVYLDMVLSEVLRKLPGFVRIERLCVSELHDSESGIHIPKETIVGIPLVAIHNDKRFYKNPDKFDPEHFSPEAKAQRNPYAYMPFGIGPRNCIGMRFALIKCKAAVAYLVHNFLIEPTETTLKELKGIRLNMSISPPAKNMDVKLTSLRT